MKGIQGVWTALPMTLDKDGNPDWRGYERNLAFQHESGITGVVPAGTTGESATLSMNQHEHVVTSTISECAGRCGVIAGVGSNNTAETIALIKDIDEQAGLSKLTGLLLVDCYYNGPSSQELRDEYYSEVASRFPQVKIVVYVIPGRTGTAIHPADIRLLMEKHPNIVSVKEASGDLDRMALTRELLGARGTILSGDDDKTLAMMADEKIRANGVISVVSNVVPKAVVDMVCLASLGGFGQAALIELAIKPLLEVVTVTVENRRILPDGKSVMVNDRYRNPVAIKTLMNGLGMPAGPCRQPLGKMSRAGVEAVRAAATMVWVKNPEVLEPIEEFYGVSIEERLADEKIWEALAA